MDQTLALTPLQAALPLDRPFTPAMARLTGVGKRSLERMLREGVVRRLLRGVYVAETAADSPDLRAAAVTLALGREAIAVDHTAAWVHGVEVLAQGAPRPVAAVTTRQGRLGSSGGSRQLVGRDLQWVGSLRVTTPLRTALDLGRQLPEPLALGAMDRLLAGGSFSHVQLLSEVCRLATQRGVGQLRVLAAQVDARSTCLAESALRLGWHQARLPTATPGVLVGSGARPVRLSLGVERRQFGAALAGRLTPLDLAVLQRGGWRVVLLEEERLLHGEQSLWSRHLEREFHQHLLAQSEAG